MFFLQPIFILYFVLKLTILSSFNELVTKMTQKDRKDIIKTLFDSGITSPIEICRRTDIPRMIIEVKKSLQRVLDGVFDEKLQISTSFPSESGVFNNFSILTSTP